MNTNTLCRCCLAEGVHKDLFNAYNSTDNKEIYAEMLQECFNIVCTQNLSTGICEKCIEILRSTLSFKRLVLKSEKVLENLHQERIVDAKKQLNAAKMNKKKARVKVKKKIGIPMKDERVPAKSIKTDLLKKDITIDIRKPSNTINVRKRKEIEIKLIRSNALDVKIKLSRLKMSNEKTKHDENLSTILKYSNAVPFKNITLVGVICGYCDATYPDPVDLRNHTVVHKKDELDLRSNRDMSEYIIKLDVQDLTCTLCGTKVENLNELKEHLVKNHDKTFHKDIKDHFIQYKLTKGDTYDCALCTCRYETFKMLKQHMNVHYDNYICQKCDSTFITKRSLMSHETTHKEGSFKCDLCDKVFPSRQKKMYHEKTKHMGLISIKHCPYCDVSFRSYYQRNLHLVKVHNAEAQYKCNICHRAFVLRSLLMCHIKQNHLMERNCQCTECGHKFFSKKALKAHMIKHTGEKNYLCEVCNKSYARKYTLREHMRIHNNDRRFKCVVCGSGFVQKCSLKSHLLSHHGISMAASEINVAN
ncbi:unnamed protein product [Leptidea sinapis]|uniref:Protein krueppel n=1 Tax=Leptidea sinapis TaxID=189913 RepID=A0A5E4R5T8_9NEOP|nr:unnamed protein product [Leptidea sinapis]